MERSRTATDGVLMIAHLRGLVERREPGYYLFTDGWDSVWMGMLVQDGLVYEQERRPTAAGLRTYFRAGLDSLAPRGRRLFLVNDYARAAPYLHQRQPF